MDRITRRQLGRATLARNLLLARSARSVPDAVRHLVGLQAQEPQEPYVGLFSRLAAFDPEEASALLERRDLVRGLLMRRTVHLVTAEDGLALRALLHGTIVQRMRGTLRRHLEGVDEDELAAAGRPLFHERPRTLPEVGRVVQERWPHVAARDLGDALSSLVALVQVPPRGLWRQAGPAANTTYAAWLGRSPVAPDPEEVVSRYLAAFGPAATADIRAWSGLAGLPAVVERMRLRTYRDERGRVLHDLPDAELPDPDVPAPPRFLPAFDNVVLGYDDRSRLIDDAHRGLSVTGARFVLVDGRVGGIWTVGDGVVAVTPLVPFRVTDELEAEAAALAAFLGASAVEWRCAA